MADTNHLLLFYLSGKDFAVNPGKLILMRMRTSLFAIAILLSLSASAQNEADSIQRIDYGVFRYQGETLDRDQVVPILSKKNDPVINRHLKKYKRKLRSAEGLASGATASLGDPDPDDNDITPANVKVSSVTTGVSLILWSIEKGKKANLHLEKAISRYNETYASGNLEKN